MALINSASSGGLTNRVNIGPGGSTATQTPYNTQPFAIGPGGGSSFGDLLSRQFQLREQMQQAQLAQMKQDLFLQKQNALRQGEIYGNARNAQSMAGSGLSGVKKGSEAWDAMQKSDQRARSYDMARELSRTYIGSLAGTDNLERMISAIGGPQVAHQGMMQSGQILGQLGSQAIGAGAQMDAQRMQSDAMRYGADTRAQTALQMQGMENQQRADQSQSGSQVPSLMQMPDGTWGIVGNNSFVGPPAPPPAPRPSGPISMTPAGPGTGGPTKFHSFEKGGRVPATGTYKLHKNEVVVPRKAADVMFPYAGGGPKKSQGKPRKSYQDGTGAVDPYLLGVGAPPPVRGSWEDIPQKERDKLLSSLKSNPYLWPILMGKEFLGAPEGTSVLLGRLRNSARRNSSSIS